MGKWGSIGLKMGRRIDYYAFFVIFVVAAIWVALPVTGPRWVSGKGRRLEPLCIGSVPRN